MASFPLRSRQVFRVQVAVILFLASANLVLQSIFLFTGHNRIFGLRELFDLDGEWNVPAIYSAVAILACAGVMLTIFAREGTRASARRSHYWLVLSGVFVYLSCDELFSLHEGLPAPFLGEIAGRGLLHSPWVVVGSAFVLVVFLSSIAFLRRQTAVTRRLMVLAGGIFVAGSIGFEALGGLYFEAAGLEMVPGRIDLPFVLLVTCEESLEMFGMALFLQALLRLSESEDRAAAVF